MAANFTPPRATAGLWQRTKWIRIAFLTGLTMGLFLGWLFHGIISFFVRFGFIVLLLLPLAIIAYFWWRSNRAQRAGGGEMTVVTWNGRLAGDDPFARQASRPPREPFGDDVLDLDDFATPRSTVTGRERDR